MSRCLIVWVINYPVIKCQWWTVAWWNVCTTLRARLTNAWTQSCFRHSTNPLFWSIVACLR